MKKDRNIVQGFSCERNYLSDVSPIDKPWDDHKKKSHRVSYLYSKVAHNKKALKINKCSKFLEFAFKENGEFKNNFKLTDAKFCRTRTCPVCQWRRSLAWLARMHEALPKIFENYPSYELIFLTLTVKNCSVKNLKSEIDNLNKAWNKMSRRKMFPGIGWIKSVEVTLPKYNYEMAHPHLHCIIMVSPKYFKTNQYLSHEKWLNLWQDSLKVNYLPSIRVKKVKLKNELLQKLTNSLGRKLTKVEQISYALREVFKYSVKEQDLIVDANWLAEITKQLHNTRAIALSGIFKEFMRADEPVDLINLENTQVEIIKEEAKFLFEWIENVGRYQSV